MDFTLDKLYQYQDDCYLEIQKNIECFGNTQTNLTMPKEQQKYLQKQDLRQNFILIFMVVRQDFMEQKQTNKRSPATNIGLAIWRLKCFYEKFVQGSRAVILLNFCAKNPPHRQALYRQLQFPYSKTELFLAANEEIFTILDNQMVKN